MQFNFKNIDTFFSKQKVNRTSGNLFKYISRSRFGVSHGFNKASYKNLGFKNLFYDRRNLVSDKFFKNIVNSKLLFFGFKLLRLKRVLFTKIRKFFWLGFFKIAPNVFWRRISWIFLKNGLFSLDSTYVYFVYKRFSSVLLESKQSAISDVFSRNVNTKRFAMRSLNLRRRLNPLLFFYRFNKRFDFDFSLFKNDLSSGLDDFLNRDFFWRKCFYVNRNVSGFSRYRKISRLYIDKDLYRSFFGFEPWVHYSFFFKASFEDGRYSNLNLNQLTKENVTYNLLFKKYIRRLVKKCNKLRFERCLYDQVGKFTVIWFHSIWGVYFRRQRRWRLVMLNTIKKWYIKGGAKAKKRKKNVKIKLALLMALYKTLGFFGTIAGSFSCLLQIICLFFKKTRRYWAILRIIKVIVSRVRVRLKTIKSFIMIVSGRFGNKNRKSKSFISVGRFLRIIDLTHRVEYFYAAADSKAGVFGISTWIQFTKPFWSTGFKSAKKNSKLFDLISEAKVINVKASQFNQSFIE